MYLFAEIIGFLTSLFLIFIVTFFIGASITYYVQTEHSLCTVHYYHGYGKY
jgi:hypothetical protein